MALFFDLNDQVILNKQRLAFQDLGMFENGRQLWGK
jgi:hypothetical protein